MRVLEVRSRNLLDNQGVRGIVANFRDVTERKRAEATLIEERNLLRTLIDSLPDAVYVKDTQSRFVLDNIRSRRNLVVVTTPPEPIAKNNCDFHSSDLAQHLSEYDE